jgi:thiamine-monophosphate kinase
MTVRELGEFALLARLQQRLKQANTPPVVRGIGDDCAVLRPADGHDLLVTTDTQEEGVHFRRDWSTPQDIGWRCLAVNVSDIAAMGGVPLGAVVALSLPETLAVAFVEAMYDGMSAMAEACDCPIIGGNISKSAERLSVTITVLGSTPQGTAAYRASARAGDAIWVTGDLGGAKAGLEALIHPQAVTGLPTDAVLARYRRPRPRLREALFLSQHGARGLIDLSDGLSSDLAHICEASGVGAQLHAEHIPISDETRRVAGALGLDALTMALHGGEDFELCLTAPPGAAAPLEQGFRDQFDCLLTHIGTIQAGAGVTLRHPDGSEESLAAGGYDHFRPTQPEARNTTQP